MNIKLLFILLFIPFLSYSQIFLHKTEEEIEKSLGLKLEKERLTEDRSFLLVSSDYAGLTYAYIFLDHKETCDEVNVLTADKEWIIGNVLFYNKMGVQLGPNKWMIQRKDETYMVVTLMITDEKTYLLKFK